MKSKQYANCNIRKYFKVGTRTNILKVERSAGFYHELCKGYIFTRLVYHGNHVVVVNGKLKNGKIPDLCVIDLKEPVGYEIESSETKKSIERKENEYPFRIVHIKTKDMNMDAIFGVIQ